MRVFPAAPVVNPAATLSRRHFLKLGSASGLLLGFQLPLSAVAAADALQPNAFVRVDSDNRVTVTIKHHEMGQGVTTGLATLVVEELDAAWSQVSIEYAGANAKLYGNSVMGGMQGTGGSTSIANSWLQLRQAGATARWMLVQAAAEAWSVPPAEISVANGVLSHGGGRQASFGELALHAAAQEVPTEVPLKDPADFKLIGRGNAPRVDSAAKTNGTAQYTIDVKLPGLLTAVIARPPVLGSTVKSFDATAAQALPGVTDVVQVPEGVAVVATGMWEAMQGRRALKVEWLPPEGTPLSTVALTAQYRKLAETPGTPVRSAQDSSTALASAARTLEAVYEFPYLAHAPMEPLNCVAWLHDGVLETWSAHQFPAFDHPLAAQAAGLSPDKVTLHSLISGGSFGRRATPESDFVVEAVHVAKAIGGRAPVRVQRTREDDMAAQYYRPLFVHAVKLGLNADGSLRGGLHRIVGQSIMAGGPMEVMIQHGIDESSVEGVVPSIYQLPGITVELHSPRQPVKPLWWRSVGHTHSAYVMETLADELAEAAGEDPLAWRLARLGEHPRMAATLKLAADKAGWGSALPQGRARGIAAAFSFRTYVAQVAEVELGTDGVPQVKRVVVAVDCGTAVNPDQIVAQMEGGVGYALSAALFGQIDIDQGRVVQSNFHDYRTLRMPEMPRVEVHIVPSQLAPTGVGEPGVPPLAPAVANALYRLTGTRQRRLPLVRKA